VITITGARDRGHSVITDTRGKLCNDGWCVWVHLRLPSALCLWKNGAISIRGRLCVSQLSSASA